MDLSKLSDEQLRALYQQSSAQEQPSQDDGSFIDNSVRAIGRGVLGVGSYLDEADAGTNAALAPYIDPLLPDSFQKLPGKTFDERYDRALAIQRGKDASFDEAHPVTSTGLQLAGGVGSGAAALMAAPVAARATLGVGGKSLAGKIGASLLSGASLGAVQGFGAGEGGTGNRAENSVVDAVIGGGLGAAVPAAGNLIGRGIRAGAARSANATSPLSGRATNLINSDLSAEGLSIPEANARASSFGPQGMIADVSPSMRLRTEQIAQSDNPGRSTVIDALKSRSAGSEGRVSSAFDSAAGEAPNVHATLEGIITQRAQQSAPLYQKALSRPVVWDERLQQFIEDPIVKKGLSQGVEIQRLESLARNEPFNPVDYAITGFNEAGDPIIGTTPNMRTLNVVKKGLDALVEENKTDFGRLTERGRAINEVRKSFLSKLDSINPDYASARKAWEGPTRTLGAFEQGRTVFSAKVHPDMLEADLAKMSEGEKDAFKLGVRSAVDEAMGRVRNGALKGRQLLDSDFNERKVIAALGKEDGTKLINALTGEQAMAETAHQALGNSPTSRRMDNPFRAQQRSATETPPGMIRSALNLRLGDAAAKGAQFIGNKLERRKVGNLANELGPFLTARGSDRDKIVQMLMDAQTRRQAAGDAALPDSRKALIQALLQSGQLSAAHP